MFVCMGVSTAEDTDTIMDVVAAAVQALSPVAVAFETIFGV